jgi:hypothetical protein
MGARGLGLEAFDLDTAVGQRSLDALVARVKAEAAG